VVNLAGPPAVPFNENMVIHPIVLDSQAVGFWRPVAHRNGIAARPTLTIDLNAPQRQPSRRPSPATPTSPASPLPSAGQGGELTAVVPLGLLENRDVACRGGELGASVAAALAAEQALWVEHAGGQRGTNCASRQCLRRNAAASAPWRRAARWPDPDSIARTSLRSIKPRSDSGRCSAHQTLLVRSPPGRRCVARRAHRS
jgi:hypothetical protein